jgi:hypothetical protein
MILPSIVSALRSFYGFGWAERPTRSHVRTVGAWIATTDAGLGTGLLIAALGGTQVPTLLGVTTGVILLGGALVIFLTFVKRSGSPRRLALPAGPDTANPAPAQRRPRQHGARATLSLSNTQADGRQKVMSNQAMRPLGTKGNLSLRLDMNGLSAARRTTPNSSQERWTWTVERFVAFNPTPEPIFVTTWLLVPLKGKRAPSELRPDDGGLSTLRLPALDKIEATLDFTQPFSQLSGDEILDPPLAVENPIELLLLEVGTDRAARVAFKVHPLRAPTSGVPATPSSTQGSAAAPSPPTTAPTTSVS